MISGVNLIGVRFQLRRTAPKICNELTYLPRRLANAATFNVKARRTPEDGGNAEKALCSVAPRPPRPPYPPHPPH